MLEPFLRYVREELARLKRTVVENERVGLVSSFSANAMPRLQSLPSTIIVSSRVVTVRRQPTGQVMQYSSLM